MTSTTLFTSTCIAWEHQLKDLAEENDISYDVIEVRIADTDFCYHLSTFMFADGDPEEAHLLLELWRILLHRWTKQLEATHEITYNLRQSPVIQTTKVAGIRQRFFLNHVITIRPKVA